MDRFCNLVEYWWTRNMDEAQRSKFYNLLQRPGAGDREQQIAEAVGPWSRDAELAEFKRASR